MRVKKSTNTNMKFFYGSVFFFAIVIVVILLFTYFVFKDAAMKNNAKILPVYQFEFGKGLEGCGCSVMLEDSLLYSTVNCNPDTVLRVKRYVVGEGDDETVHFTKGTALKIEVVGVDTLETELGSAFLYKFDISDGKLSVTADE